MQPVVFLLLLPFCVCELPAPPETWQETWYMHTDLLTRQYYDDEVAVYFDTNMNKSIDWMNSYLHKVWVYVKKTYGNFGDDPRLYAIYHRDCVLGDLIYFGGQVSCYLDSNIRSNKNFLDLGKNGDDAWASGTENDLEHTLYYVGRVVLVANNGVWGNPQLGLGDNTWCEIFQYDALLGLNMTKDANDLYQWRIRSKEAFPRSDTYWFRDWYLPIYEGHGGTKVLLKFFALLAEYFPKTNNAVARRPSYARNLNMGEFVHFWSGAARINLKGLAREAFGWNRRYEEQWRRARVDFPYVKYHNIVVF